MSLFRSYTRQTQLPTRVGADLLQRSSLNLFKEILFTQKTIETAAMSRIGHPPSMHWKRYFAKPQSNPPKPAFTCQPEAGIAHAITFCAFCVLLNSRMWLTTLSLFISSFEFQNSNFPPPNAANPSNAANATNAVIPRIQNFCYTPALTSTTPLLFH